MDTVPARPDDAKAWLDARGAQGLQVGSYNVQHNHLGYTPPIVRSAYLEQVRRIAPPELKDRDAELAELAAFCTGDSDYEYAWWRAPAWAGKSALMSWFALHPPPMVRIVSFFITARHHRQNDRKAFVDNVLVQLAELLEYRGLPAGLTDSTQDSHLASMLVTAAAACLQSGERLVLLVDGLDEDRGVTVGSESHSVAAILPRRPPAGLRIVVSSRPDPPLPADVPMDHPLRGRCRVRELRQSAYAEVVRADAERELKRFLIAGGVERDILGFVIAAGSGLSTRELAELVDKDEWLVEDYLTSFTGRTFARTDAVCWLAHEELQSTATRLLGPSRLRDYRQRLHEWVDRYRDLGWPLGTPDYVLRGYLRMVSEQGDTARLMRYAADVGRHDRMLDRTGGDAGALEEITLAQDALLASAEPDLPTMCKLALRRADLEERNTNVPISLPRLWAAVGDVSRAEALARSIPEDGGRRAAALILLAPAVAAAGHHNRAELLAGLIPARVYMDADQPEKAICEVVRKIAEGGEHDRAAALARSIDDPVWQSRAHSEVAIALAVTGGGLVEAESLALRIPMPYWRAQALAVLAKEAAHRGQKDLAERLAGSAESEADTLPTDSDRALLYAFLAQQIESWGGASRSRRLASMAVEQASSLGDPCHRVETLSRIFPLLAKILDREELADLARLAESTLTAAWEDHRITLEQHIPLVGATASAWYTAGDPDHALAVTNVIADPFNRDSALLWVVGAAASAGNLGSARALVDSFADPAGKDRALGRLVATLIDEDNDEHMADLVNAIQDRACQATALTDWGYRAAKRNDIAAATDLAKRAEAIGRSAGDPDAKARLLTSLVSLLVAAGDIGRARSAARLAMAAYRAIPERLRLDSQLATLVQATIHAGDYDSAAAAARLIKDPHARAEAQADLASSISQRDDRDIAVRLLSAAETTAMAIPQQYRRLEVLRKILTVLWTIREDELAEELTRRMMENDAIIEPSQIAELPVFPTFHAADERTSSLVAEERDEALARAVEAVAAAGDFARAETLGGLIVNQRLQAEARTSMVLALAHVGEHDRARALAHSEGHSYRRGRCLSKLADVLAGQGAIELAEEVAYSIEDDFDRSGALIALARKAESARARSLLLFPVRHGMLPDIVDLIAEVCPQAVEVIVDHLLSEEDP
jgi:hypothetical protein